MEEVELHGYRDCMDAGGRATQDAKAESCDGRGRLGVDGPSSVGCIRSGHWSENGANEPDEAGWGA